MLMNQKQRNISMEQVWMLCLICIHVSTKHQFNWSKYDICSRRLTWVMGEFGIFYVALRSEGGAFKQHVIWTFIEPLALAEHLFHESDRICARMIFRMKCSVETGFERKILQSLTRVMINANWFIKSNSYIHYYDSEFAQKEYFARFLFWIFDPVKQHMDLLEIRYDKRIIPIFGQNTSVIYLADIG